MESSLLEDLTKAGNFLDLIKDREILEEQDFIEREERIVNEF